MHVNIRRPTNVGLAVKITMKIISGEGACRKRGGAHGGVWAAVDNYYVVAAVIFLDAGAHVEAEVVDVLRVAVGEDVQHQRLRGCLTVFHEAVAVCPP